MSKFPRKVLPLLCVTAIVAAFDACERHHLEELASEQSAQHPGHETKAEDHGTPAPAGTPAEFFRHEKTP